MISHMCFHKFKMFRNFSKHVNFWLREGGGGSLKFGVSRHVFEDRIIITRKL